MLDLPPPHELQVVEALVAEYLPDEQLEQELAPLLEYLPAEQDEQLDEVEAAYFPAAQLPDAAPRPDDEQYDPEGQAVHAEADAAA